jgi:UDP-N-acetyl-D-mannosaminuronic acid transferase (WecB/TagA/CpsF family)
MTDRLAERLAREAVERAHERTGLKSVLAAGAIETVWQETERALRAFQAEAARVAREHGYYGPGVNDEIADAIEAL